ncbi:MAG TPA: MFS transporter [Phenylobacterium sp.]
MAQTATATPRLSFGIKLIYGLGSIAYGIKNQLFGLLLIFYNQLMGMPPETVTLALSISMVLDSLWDPMVGHFSDGLRTRWGRRHPLMYFSAVPFALSFYMLWNPPAGLSEQMLFFWLLAFVILSRATISLYEVPSSALAPELAPSYDERTVLLSYRYFFGVLGGTAAAIMGYGWFLRSTPEQKMGQLNIDGYGPYALTVSIITFVVILLSTLGTHSRIPTLHKPPQQRAGLVTIAKQMFGTLSNRNFLVILMAGLLSGITSGMVQGLGIYFSTYFWELPSSSLLIIVLSSLVATPMGATLAPALSRKIGKKHAAIALAALGLTISITPITLRLVDLMPANGTNLLVGILLMDRIFASACSTGAAILLSSMLADIVEESQLKTGRRSEALLMSADNTLQRMVSGLSILLPGLILAYVNFPKKAKPGMVPEEILNQMALLYVPAIFVASMSGIALLSLYRINRMAHERNIATLRETAAELETSMEADPTPTPPGTIPLPKPSL